jgi:hypothetical protein
MNKNDKSLQSEGYKLFSQGHTTPAVSGIGNSDLYLAMLVEDLIAGYSAGS